MYTYVCKDFGMYTQRKRTGGRESQRETDLHVAVRRNLCIKHALMWHGHVVREDEPHNRHEKELYTLGFPTKARPVAAVRGSAKDHPWSLWASRQEC